MEKDREDFEIQGPMFDLGESHALLFGGRARCSLGCCHSLAATWILSTSNSQSSHLMGQSAADSEGQKDRHLSADDDFPAYNKAGDEDKAGGQEEEEGGQRKEFMVDFDIQGPMSSNSQSSHLMGESAADFEGQKDRHLSANDDFPAYNKASDEDKAGGQEEEEGGQQKGFMVDFDIQGPMFDLGESHRKLFGGRAGCSLGCCHSMASTWILSTSNSQPSHLMGQSAADAEGQKDRHSASAADYAGEKDTDCSSAAVYEGDKDRDSFGDDDFPYEASDEDKAGGQEEEEVGQREEDGLRKVFVDAILEHKVMGFLREARAALLQKEWEDKRKEEKEKLKKKREAIKNKREIEQKKKQANGKKKKK